MFFAKQKMSSSYIRYLDGPYRFRSHAASQHCALVRELFAFIKTKKGGGVGLAHNHVGWLYTHLSVPPGPLWCEIRP
jgi:hypothetical protein